MYIMYVGCLDPLFRLDTTGPPPPIHRRNFRTTKGTSIQEQPAHVEQLWNPPRNDSLRKPTPADVHLCSAERAGNVLTRVRLSSRWWCGQQPSRIFNLSIKSRREWEQQHGRRSRERSQRANGIPLQSKGNLLVRGKPGRRQRDQFFKARDP